MLDGMQERSLMDKTMKQFHEFELKNTITLASKAIGMVEVPSVFEKDSPLKIVKSEDIAQFSNSVQAAFDRRSVTLKGRDLRIQNFEMKHFVNCDGFKSSKKKSKLKMMASSLI